MDKIKIENLELYYGDFHALKTINLDLPANQIRSLRLSDRLAAESPHF